MHKHKDSGEKRRTNSGGRNESDRQPEVREQGGKGGAQPLKLLRVREAPPFSSPPATSEVEPVMSAPTTGAEASELAEPPIGGVDHPFLSGREQNATKL
jgi:hypothetical protein